MEYQFPHRAAEALADLGRFLAQTLDRNLVARRIADGARVLLDAQAAWVFRLDADVGAPTVLGAAGDEEPVGVGVALAENEGPVALAARDCRPVATAGLLSDERIAVTPEAHQTLARSVEPSIAPRCMPSACARSWSCH